jgi:hypothetical protein
MDAADLQEVINDINHPCVTAYQLCVKVLEKARALPGMDNYTGQTATQTVAELLGDAIKQLVWNYARREHGVPDNEVTLTSSVLARALGSISSTDLGALYYVTTRENWCYEHGIEPYPARNS